jgi:hypothetical protein
MPMPSFSDATAADPAPTRALASPLLELHHGDDPRRREVEQFIRRVYLRHYGARVEGFAPVLVSLRDSIDREIVAAAGYRPALHGRLYLERYLEAAVESVIAAHADRPPLRAEIVEIAHLSAGRPGAGRALMFLLGPHLADQGFGWAVSTLTRELRHLLVRMGIEPLALARADARAAADDATDWGTYYEHQPVVLAGELQPALRRLAQLGPLERGFQ